MLLLNMSAAKPAFLQETFNEIKSIRIQGATNVALAVIEALSLWAKRTKEQGPLFAKRMHEHGWWLATARPNEPLAKNAIYFLDAQVTKARGEVNAKQLIDWGTEYTRLVEDAKKKIVAFGLQNRDVAQADTLFTHCHSSTVEALLAARHKSRKIEVVHTETRPLFQGRITAKKLIKHGLKPRMIVDDAAAYFIKDDDIGGSIDVVLLGADQILPNGDTLNKVGSYGMALSAFFAHKPVYIVTPALKLDTTASIRHPLIEMRKGKEIWPDAPRQLELINPSFDIINHRFIKGFITELGVLDPDELLDVVSKAYPWLPSR